MNLVRVRTRRRALLLVACAALAGATVAQGSLNLARGSSAPVLSLADGTVVEGASARLLRGLDWLAADVVTSELEADGTYTVWWVLFNNPSGCSPLPDDPARPVCDEDDIFGEDGALDPNPRARVSLAWGGGNVADGDGRAVFNALLRAGEAPGEVLVGSGLERENGLRAEVHVVLRGHGPADAARLWAQINSFEADCEACGEVQAAVFPPAP